MTPPNLLRRNDKNPHRTYRLPRIVRIVALVAAFVVVVTSLYIRVEQWRFRHRMEQLLEDVRSLELGKASAADARRVVQRWHFGEIMLNGKCNDSDCDYRLQRFNPIASIFIDHFGASRAARRILILLGGRPVLVTSFIQVRDGRVWLKGYSLMMSALGPNDQGFVMGSSDTAGRWASGGRTREHPAKLLAGSLRHEDYLVGTYTATINADYGARESGPAIWVEFSPYADAKTVNRLMRLNLSCITRVRSCGVGDLMPEVWNETERDEQRPAPSFTCTSDLVRRVARIADTIAVVRIDSPELESLASPNDALRMYHVSVIRLVRKPDYLRKESAAWVELDDPKTATVADDGERLRAGEQYIFLLQDKTIRVQVVALYPCGILTLNDANLEMVQETAAKSIE
jgi:hypothetical protein